MQMNDAGMTLDGGGGGVMSDDFGMPQRSHRTLSELYAESQSLLQQHSQPLSSQAATAIASSSSSSTTPAMHVIDPSNDQEAHIAALGAQALLGSSYYYYHPQQQQQPPASTQQLPSSSSSSSFWVFGQSPEERATIQEQEILVSFMERVNQQTRQQTREKVDAFLQAKWERDRNVWLSELIGTRTLGGASGALSSEDATIVTNHRHVDQNNLKLRLLPSSNNTAKEKFENRGGRFTGRIESTTTHTALSQYLDPDLVQDHLAIIQQYMTPRFSAPIPAIEAFFDLPERSPASPALLPEFIMGGEGERAMNAGYRTAWQLLLNMATISTNSTAFTNSTNHTPSRLSPMRQAVAALATFAAQFQSHIRDSVIRQQQPQKSTRVLAVADKSSLVHTNYTHAFADAVSQYVTFFRIGGRINDQLPSSSSPSPSSMVWPMLYYCLRSGDAVAAAQVLQAAKSRTGLASIIHESVVRVVDMYARIQGDAPSLWTALDIEKGLATLFQSDDCMAVRDLCTNASSSFSFSSSFSSSSSSPSFSSSSSFSSLFSHEISQLFQLSAYALLAGCTLPTQESVMGLCSIEDYLTSRLWQAILDTQHVNTKLIELGRSMRNNLGPDYFGLKEPWAYALPLWATQQYKSALEHLVSSSLSLNPPVAKGLLQACHLALVLTNMIGVAACDLDDDDDDTINDSGNENATTYYSSNKSINISSSSSFSPTSPRLVAKLIKDYARMILPLMGATSALEYLVRLPTLTQASSAASHLIAQTAALSELAGTINEQGRREGGAECLKTFELDVSLVLTDAAEIVLKAPAITREIAGKAIMCYMLAGRYAEVLRILNQRIFPPNHPHSNTSSSINDQEERAYWMKQSEEFHDHYLVKLTHVSQLLESTTPKLVFTNRTLVGLNRFYIAINDNRKDEAWQLLSHLNVLPISRADLIRLEAAYRNYDPLMQNALPTLLTTIVQLLFDEHQNLKMNLSYPGGDILRTRIEQIKTQMSLYVSYAGMIGMSEQMISLSRAVALVS